MDKRKTILFSILFVFWLLILQWLVKVADPMEKEKIRLKAKEMFFEEREEEDE